MKQFSAFLLFVISVACLVWAGLAIHLTVQFNMGCSGHLRRAALASAPEIATAELDIAVKYLERHAVTNGNTSIFYDAPENDVSFWYRNLVAAYVNLANTPEIGSNLEASNKMLKLKEVLITQVEGNARVNKPNRIAFYPHSTLAFITGWLCVISFGISLFVFCLWRA
jgi:hypothetical protein